MIPDDWMPHHRDDGEVVGYARLAGDGAFQAMDLLGRPLDEPGEWADVEATLEGHSIAWLDGAWTLALADGGSARVRILEVSTAGAVLVEDRGGAVGGAQPARYALELPVAEGALVRAAPVDEWPAAPPPPASEDREPPAPA